MPRPALAALRVAVAAALPLAVAIAAPAVAQESPRFAHLSVEDGLSQSSVQQILQDRKGLLWFGTQEGLNRYDGYRFTVHRAREQEGFLRDHDITAMAETSDGDLWVGTSRGLYRYDLDTGRFDTCAPPVNQLGIVDLIASGDGRIFFAASDGRLWVLDRGDAPCRAQPLGDGAFAPLLGVSALAPAQGSAIWAAARGQLFKVDVAADPARQVSEVLHDLGVVPVLARDREGHVWIGRNAGELLRYRPGDGTVDRFPHVARPILTIVPAKSGAIWIGARGGGLSRLDPNSGALAVYRHDADDPSSLSSDNVAAIYEDAAGSLWIGSWNGGVDRFDPDAQALRTFRRRPRAPDSLPADDVTAMAESPDGALWLASRSSLIMTGDPRSGRFRTVTTLPARGTPMAIAWWDGRLIVGTTAGLFAIDARSGREVPLDDALRAHVLGARRIVAIRDARGGVWIASGREALRAVRADPSAPLRVERLPLAIAGSLSALSIARSNRMWIGTDAGEVQCLEWSGVSTPAAVLPLQLDASARASLEAHGFIAALHEDQQGRVWVGTRRGLGRIDAAAGTVSWLGEQDGLPSTNISGIAADASGVLWVGHNRGLTRIDPGSGAMTHFGEREGAQGKGYAEGAWAAGGSGLIYFAGAGITAFDPRAVRVSPSAPRILFTGLEVLHRAVAPDWLDPGSPLQRTIDAQQEVTLGADATVFSVEMAPLHYVDPPSNRLAYRLEGFDPEWIETGAHHRVATYTNLAPGRYVLRARAGTRNGVWSERDAILAIRILPPWWRTRGALAGWIALTLAFALLAWVAVRRRESVRVALRERDALRRDSLTDPLTGLHNRRFLIGYLQHEVPRVLREYRVRGAVAAEAGEDLLLLLIDVDRFKSINDLHSHAVGDRVLTRIAAALRAQVRDSDLAVRWGGDEFLVVCRGFRRAGAAHYAERLRAGVAASEKTLAEEGGPACTLSIGFAAFPFLPREPEALTWEQTLELADHALRRTKARTRNSYAGLRAGVGLHAAAVLEFLAAGGNAPLPPGVEIVMPDET
jgi:diguanylate cyclase (GGDEF)-like protein